MKTKTEKATERKRQRTIKKIYEIIKDNNAIFLTLSFNDATISKTNAETRKRYIKDFLNNETALYIANIDYGKNKGREHYHAIVKANTIKDLPERFYFTKDLINLKAYKYGNINADFIRATDKPKETAKRLYNHAIKETTKGNKIIYSRTEPTRDQQIARLIRFERALQNKAKDSAQKLEIIDEIDEILNNAYDIDQLIARKYKGFFDA